MCLQYQGILGWNYIYDEYEDVNVGAELNLNWMGIDSVAYLCRGEFPGEIDGIRRRDLDNLVYQRWKTSTQSIT